MGKSKGPALSIGEHIIDEITATMELKEYTGVIYTFGNLIATNQRLILYTQYPVIGLKEQTVYHYDDVIWVDAVKALFSLNNGVTIAVKLVNNGNARLLSEMIRVFSDYASGISNFHQINSDI